MMYRSERRGAVAAGCLSPCRSRAAPARERHGPRLPARGAKSGPRERGAPDFASPGGAGGGSPPAMRSIIPLGKVGKGINVQEEE